MTAIRQTTISIKRAFTAAALLLGLFGIPGIAAGVGAQPQPVQPEMTKKTMLSSSDITDEHACNADGIALAGIDVVSYHTATGPLIGNPAFSVLHNGLTYRFLSEEHLHLFIATPVKYQPKYLGWCATSLAVGALTCPNPLNYKIENGELLLFETTGFTNGQDLWNADPLDYRRRADRNKDNFLSKSGDVPG